MRGYVLASAGLGYASIPSGVECRGGTWVLSGADWDCTGSEYTPPALPGGSGATSIGPDGTPLSCGVSDAPLSAAARSGIEAAGPRLLCRTHDAPTDHAWP